MEEEEGEISERPVESTRKEPGWLRQRKRRIHLVSKVPEQQRSIAVVMMDDR